MTDPHEPPVLLSIEACLLHMDRQLDRIERRSLVRLRQNYGIYATLTLVVATLIIGGLQRLGSASDALLKTTYVVDAALCLFVWVTMFVFPLVSAPGGAGDGG